MRLFLCFIFSLIPFSLFAQPTENQKLHELAQVSRGFYPRPAGEPLPPFAFTNHLNQPFLSTQLEGKLTVLNFIFTQCKDPSMCPASTQKIRILQQQLPHKDFPELQFVTVTLNPEDDTPETLNNYFQAYELQAPNCFLLTGDSQPIHDFTKVMGILSQKHDGTLLHNSVIYLINADLRIYFSLSGKDWDPKKLIDSIQLLHKNYTKSSISL